MKWFMRRWGYAWEASRVIRAYRQGYLEAAEVTAELRELRVRYGLSDRYRLREE